MILVGLAFALFAVLVQFFHVPVGLAAGLTAVTLVVVGLLKGERV